MTMHAREEDDQDERIPSLTRLIHALHLGLLSISTQALFLVDHQVEPAFWGIAVILILNGIECVTFCGSKSKASSHKRDPHKVSRESFSQISCEDVQIVEQILLCLLLRLSSSVNFLG
eukprot:m.216734 g.216734  ORF g.216734 m.216734 type:complete len:118 (+) comp39874_c0_seq22:199-552(+)